VINISPI